MRYIISATVRMTLATLTLIGVCFLILLGVLNLLRDLFADAHNHQPALADDDIRQRNSLKAG